MTLRIATFILTNLTVYLLLSFLLVWVFKYIISALLIWYVLLALLTEYGFHTLTLPQHRSIGVKGRRFVDPFPNFHTSPMRYKLQMLFFFKEILIDAHHPRRLKAR